ncbi:hypothetical protein AcV7_007707 [Taiwanofungus camphoratus]|nr:hypothetical protein AcV7_007707 [Antrodia cinnamomea]
MTARKNKTRNKKKTRKKIRSRAIKGVLRLAMFDGWEQVRCAPGNRVRQPSASAGRRAAHAHLPMSRSGCHRGPRRRGRSPSRGPRGYPVPLSGRRAQACGRRLGARWGGRVSGLVPKRNARVWPAPTGDRGCRRGPCGSDGGVWSTSSAPGRCTPRHARAGVRPETLGHGTPSVRGPGITTGRRGGRRGGAGAVVHAAVRGADDRRRGRRGRGARTLPGRHGDAAPPAGVVGNGVCWGTRPDEGRVVRTSARRRRRVAITRVLSVRTGRLEAGGVLSSAAGEPPVFESGPV